jgi:hypothetical protein
VTVNVRLPTPASKCHATCAHPSGVLSTPNVPGEPDEPTAAFAPGEYRTPPSETWTSSIDSARATGINLNAPWKRPSKSNVRRSVAWTVPFGSTTKVSFASLIQ